MTGSIKRYLKNIAARRCCQAGESSVLYDTANIVNNLGIKDRIVIGRNCHVRGELLVFGHGGKIELGDYCYVGRNSYLWSAVSIRLGSHVLISHNCNIFDNDTHPLNPRKRHEQFKAIITRGQPSAIDLKEEAVVIGDDVLISANSTILKGVTVGEGAVIGAGSVVTRDVPSFTIVAGNPAQIIRKLSPEELQG